MHREALEVEQIRWNLSHISEPEDRNIQMFQVEEERELRFFKSKETLEVLSYSLRRANTVSMVYPKEKREKGTESIFKEIKAGNFSNLGKELDILVSEAN